MDTLHVLMGLQQQLEQFGAKLADAAEQHADADCDCMFCVSLRGAVKDVEQAVASLAFAVDAERDPGDVYVTADESPLDDHELPPGCKW
jgi:hypothetical protein